MSMDRISMSRDRISLLLLGIILFFVCLYIGAAVQRGTNNCNIIRNYSQQSMEPIDTNTLGQPLKRVFVKTAYNCCCTGDFKNDYVDTCALLNCAKQGVRALDFTLYSLHGEPVISASTLNSKKYKEMYNSLPFAKTMAQVKQMFLYDSANCQNIRDPLFLILRIQSNNTQIFNKIGEILQNTFGDGNSTGSVLYHSNGDPLDDESIANLMGKVVIMVDTNSKGIQGSILSPLVALQLGTLTNQIYRETEAYDVLVSGASPNESKVNILYPDYQPKNNNYDYETVGIQQNFQFIGMNFQLEDVYLDAYNRKFNRSILTQPNKIKA